MSIEPAGFMPFAFVMLFFFGAVFGVAAFAFWLWMLIDCLKYESSEGNDKVIWVLVIIFVNWIGALVYFFVRRQPRNAANRAA